MGDAMNLTEEEAREKWCPFTRMAYLESEPMIAGYNRRTDSGWDDCEGVHCIASECMAWRWAEGDTEYCFGYSEGGQRLSPPEGDGWIESAGGWTRTRPNRSGHCGLAGRP